jgi:hypothetical protein
MNHNIKSYNYICKNCGRTREDIEDNGGECKKIHDEYIDANGGLKSSFKYITEDTRGLELAEPMLSVSIEGSPYLSVDEIIKRSEWVKNNRGKFKDQIK